MWTTFGITVQGKKNNKVTSVHESLNITPALTWGKDTAMAGVQKWWQYVLMYFKISGFQLVLRETRLFLRTQDEQIFS